MSATIAAIAAALLIYSQTMACGWDEGFHLLAAQLISQGRRPYADFLFAQTPLNAYWNALLIGTFGATWRPTHVASALETAGAVLLTAGFIWRRFPVMEWRIPLAITAAVLAGLNVGVFEYAVLAQPYGLCLLLTVSAFVLAVSAKDRQSSLLAALSGVAGGAAASASLLTAPVGPVLLIWLAIRTRNIYRVASFLAGAAAGLTPVLLGLFRQPGQFWFDVVGFHIYFRQVEWDDWLTHDLGVVTDWLNSSQIFILLALTAAGLYGLRRSEWAKNVRSEFYLSAWLAAAESVFVATAHPTFPQYFLLAVPFAAIVAATGVYQIVPRDSRRLQACAAVAALTIAGLGRSLYGDRGAMKWSDFDEPVRTVNRVTAPGAPIYADEQVYFLTRRTPPPGMEWMSGHKIRMPLDKARPLHVLPQPEIDRQVKQGAFSTVETCYDSEVDRLDLKKIYAQEKEMGDCYVFWDRRH